MASFEGGTSTDGGPVLGIDLGTTFSCVAVFDDEAKEVKVLANSEGARTTPSYVSFTDEGRVVGAAAKAQSAANAKGTLFDVKRILGRTYEDHVVQDESKRLPFPILEHPKGKRPLVEVTWRGEKKRFAPEEVSAMVLGEMVAIAKKRLGRDDLNRAVITVPAHFNDQQRQATKDAGRIAGLEVMRIINEPTAAALAYGLHDLASDENNPKQSRATGGDTHLGGEDFDAALVEHVVMQYARKRAGTNVKEKKKNNGHKNQKGSSAAEKKKKAEETKYAAELRKSSKAMRRLAAACEVTRQAFEGLCGHLFESCLRTVESVVRDAQCELSQITEIVLVGGSTRVPRLQEALYQLFDEKLELCKSVHPDEAVAVGAAVQGAILRAGMTHGGEDLAPEGCKDLVLLDVTPLSLGIELEGGVMSTLIKRSTPIPCAKTREYTTCDDYQTAIDVAVYEGERPAVSANNKLGEFKIDGIERARKGEPKVEVTFALDANGILAVSARDKVTGASASTQIKADRGRLEEEDIQRMIEDAKKYREDDAAFADKAGLRNALEEAAFAAKAACKDDAKKATLENMLEWLEYDAEDASMDELNERVKTMKVDFGVSVSA
ncbi:ATP binding protein [Aureococcus anophagefferens]|nr:ATP binding protein [Aureococcus anophagefferens]